VKESVISEAKKSHSRFQDHGSEREADEAAKEQRNAKSSNPATDQ
jgi:hypothetical protein